MTAPRYMLARLMHGAALLLGVTFVSFLLMVHFGPDKTYDLLGKNATPEQIAELRHELGYDRPFLARYLTFLGELTTLNLGLSDTNGEPVAGLISRTLPVTLALVLPGFLLGNLLGIGLGMLAAAAGASWTA